MCITIHYKCQCAAAVHVLHRRHVINTALPENLAGGPESTGPHLTPAHCDPTLARGEQGGNNEMK